MIDLKDLNIFKARQKLVKGEISSKDLLKACLEEIKKNDKEIHAFLEVFEDALEQAKEADKKIKEGKDLPLLGIPLAVKDNILIDGKKAGAASKILEGYVAPYDATAIKNLKEAGAIFIGRTNMDEFAMGSSTENSAYGPTKNPYDFSRVAGGSSGGSAAAVGSSQILGALGSDTGGSVRQPSSFCGVVGLKPTYGSVSRYGLIAMGSSLDVIGPIGKTVSDVETIFNVIKGKDNFDSTSFWPADRGLSNGRRPKKIGLIKGLIDTPGIHPDVKKNFAQIISKLSKEEFVFQEIEIPLINLSLAVYYIIMPAEASSNLARFDGVKYGLLKQGSTLQEDYFETRGFGFGEEPRRRIILGTYVLSSGYHDQYYNKAIEVRNIIKSHFNNAFQMVDAIITPTTPTPAFKLGEKTNDPLAMYLEDVFTVPANLTKSPAITIPSGLAEIDGKKLPLGIQIMAPHYKEDILFRLGEVIEKIR